MGLADAYLSSRWAWMRLSQLMGQAVRVTWSAIGQLGEHAHAQADSDMRCVCGGVFDCSDARCVCHAVTGHGQRPIHRVGSGRGFRVIQTVDTMCSPAVPGAVCMWLVRPRGFVHHADALWFADHR